MTSTTNPSRKLTCHPTPLPGYIGPAQLDTSDGQPSLKQAMAAQLDTSDGCQLMMLMHWKANKQASNQASKEANQQAVNLIAPINHIRATWRNNINSHNKQATLRYVAQGAIHRVAQSHMQARNQDGKLNYKPLPKYTGPAQLDTMCVFTCIYTCMLYIYIYIYIYIHLSIHVNTHIHIYTYV